MMEFPGSRSHMDKCSAATKCVRDLLVRMLRLALFSSGNERRPVLRLVMSNSPKEPIENRLAEILSASVVWHLKERDSFERNPIQSGKIRRAHQRWHTCVAG